ncbi:MAG TPA: precorrin-6y C5,15-methyltransferase (decarboxylating) subunit CbiE [Acidimicrobiales bacterium]
MVEAPIVTVIGLASDRLGDLSRDAVDALGSAELVVGGERHLAAWRSWRPLLGADADAAGRVEMLAIGADADAAALEVRRAAVDGGRRVCVLASGDPGFFGILRALLRALDRRSLRVLPAASSVAVAFARLGLPWDDAAVVSAHGRPLVDAVRAARTRPKVAVLTSPDAPPQALGSALVDLGLSFDLVAVCSSLGTPSESVDELDLAQLAAGSFDPLSVVVLVGPAGLPPVGWSPAGGSPKPLGWGLPDDRFAHRAGMITKAEVRSVVLGKLELPPTGVLWDVGAGSASVAIEAALARPGMTVLAVEASPEAAAQATANVADLQAGVHVVLGRAPEVLATLPAPDRVFVGGGGLEVLRSVLGHLGPGGRAVATFAALDRAAAAGELLGNLAQIAVSAGERLPDGAWRLAARNPVFVAWGPT